MIMLTNFVALAITFATPISGKIISAERHEAFAGKLGYRIQYTLMVETSGKQVRVQTPRTHTRTTRVLPEYKVGDTISLKGNAIFRF